MSMSNYAEYGYGIVFTDDDVDKFLEQNDMELYDVTDTGAIVMDEDYENKAVMFLNDCEEYPSIAIVLPLQKFPTLFGKAYDTPDDCVEEIKNNYNFNYEGFDLEKHIAEYSGSVFC